MDAAGTADAEAPALLRRRRRPWPCVMVRAVGPDDKGKKASGSAFYSRKDGRTSVSGSGILFRIHGGTADADAPPLVLTSGHLLAHFLRFARGRRPELRKGCRLAVRFPTASSNGAASTATVGNDWVPASLAAVAEVPGTAAAAGRLLRWPQPARAGVTVGHVAILRLQTQPPPPPAECNCGAFSLCTPPYPPAPRLGQRVALVSSPFGLVFPRVFENTLACGVVSTLAGPSLLLTDAPACAGAEGGALVCVRSGALVAVAAPRLVRRGGEALELSAAIPAAALGPAVAAALSCDDADSDPRRSKL